MYDTLSAATQVANWLTTKSGYYFTALKDPKTNLWYTTNKCDPRCK